jgi:hypothetical protein
VHHILDEEVEIIETWRWHGYFATFYARSAAGEEITILSLRPLAKLPFA